MQNDSSNEQASLSQFYQLSITHVLKHLKTNHHSLRALAANNKPHYSLENLKDGGIRFSE